MGTAAPAHPDSKFTMTKLLTPTPPLWTGAEPSILPLYRMRKPAGALAHIFFLTISFVQKRSSKSSGRTGASQSLQINILRMKYSMDLLVPEFTYVIQYILLIRRKIIFPKSMLLTPLLDRRKCMTICIGKLFTTGQLEISVHTDMTLTYRRKRHKGSQWGSTAICK